jgi:Zn-dependent protease
LPTPGRASCGGVANFSLLAAVEIHNPVLWAVFIAWILTVVLHEFAHGVVAYFGGDYTIRERGGLTLNPIQYVDPVFSLLVPAVIFLLGGIPFPGGVTYVRRDLIRSRAWNVAVNAAGPAMNFLLFLLCVLPFHPKLQWLTPQSGPIPNGHQFLGAMAVLQIVTVLFNLVPVPPLDGFQMLSAFMDAPTREKFMRNGSTMFLIFFLLLWNVPALTAAFFTAAWRIIDAVGIDPITAEYFRRCYNSALFGASD